MKIDECENKCGMNAHISSSLQHMSDSASKVRKVSIIVAYSSSRKHLLQKFLGSLESVHQNDEIEAEVLLSCEGNRSECLNSLAKKATGDILLFFDDDVELRGNTIEELVEPFHSGEFNNVGIVGGVNIPLKNATKSELRADALLTSSLTMFRSRARYSAKGGTRLTDESEILTCNMAVLRKAFEEVGGFPEDIIPCEENVLTNRIAAKGYSIVYTPFAVVYHRRPKLFREYARAVFNYGKGRGIMMRRRAGNPKLLTRPSWNWLAIPVGVVVHYVSYISGLVYGYFKKPKKSQRCRGQTKNCT